jgi:hypothetical protein
MYAVTLCVFQFLNKYVIVIGINREIAIIRYSFSKHLHNRRSTDGFFFGYPNVSLIYFPISVTDKMEALHICHLRSVLS